MTIYKHSIEITPRPRVSLPEGAKILSFQVQNGVPTIWFVCDDHAPLVGKLLRLVGTGSEVEAELADWRFIGTIQVGRFVWHLFDPKGTL